MNPEAAPALQGDSDPSESASTVGIADKFGPCIRCGRPQTRNPHPHAGEPDHEEAGYVWHCVPCLVENRHRWAVRARRAEAVRNVRDWQAKSAEWITRFPDDDLPQRGLVAGEESGELLEAAVAVTIGVGRVQRCILKAEQDIRGGTEFWLDELRGELADVFFALTSTAHRAGFDLADAIEAKWARIEHKVYATGPQPSREMVADV